MYNTFQLQTEKMSKSVRKEEYKRRKELLDHWQRDHVRFGFLFKLSRQIHEKFQFILLADSNSSLVVPVGLKCFVYIVKIFSHFVLKSLMIFC